MEKIGQIILLFAIIALNSCSSDNECEDIACMTPPSPLYFEIIDETTGLNAFESGLIEPGDIYITNKDSENVPFDFLNQRNLIRMSEITFTTGPHVYQLGIKDELLISFKLDMKIEEVNCCTFSKLVDFKVISFDYEFDEEEYWAKIFINLNPEE